MRRSLGCLLAFALTGTAWRSLRRSFHPRSMVTSRPRCMTGTSPGRRSRSSAAIASLVDDKVLAWDDPVRRHLPALERFGAWLLDHRQHQDQAQRAPKPHGSMAGSRGLDLTDTAPVGLRAPLVM
jgi:hypothetical protein